MPELKANDCTFYYEDAGEGPAIVFIHGESHGTILFDPQVAEFSSTHRCFSYDRRGHGKSELTEYGYSLWNQVVDLKCILDTAKIERAVIVAVAMSTPLAATFTLNYPERVDGLVLCSWYEMDGYPALEERRKAHPMSFADAHLKMRDILVEKGRAALEEYFEANHKTFLSIFPPDKPEVRRKLVELFASHPPEHYPMAAEYYTSIPNVRAHFRGVTCPVLGICGTDDPSPDDPSLLSGMKNFRQEWVKGARRFTTLEYPEEFNAILRKFLLEVAERP